MITKDLKKLATTCFVNGVMDDGKVLNVVKYLKKKELRIFIKFLKLLDKKNTVIVYVSDKKFENIVKKALNKHFWGKKIVIVEDKDLIAGIRIVDYDSIYDFSLKNSIANTVNYINE